MPLTIQCSSAHSLEAVRAALHQYFSNQPGPKPKVGALRLIEFTTFILMFECRLGDPETGGDSGFGKQPHLYEPPQELGKIQGIHATVSGLPLAYFCSDFLGKIWSTQVSKANNTNRA